MPSDFGTRERLDVDDQRKDERAYATLKPDYFIDDDVIMANNGAAGMGGADPSLKGNKPPVLTIDGPTTRTAKAGETVTLAAVAGDDKIPGHDRCRR